MIPSASSFPTASLTALGALSTISFASFNPRPVNSFTALTTCNLEPPGALRITSNSDFSSAAAPSPPPAPGAATATAAAAGSIPYSSLRTSASSFTSFTVKFTNSSATVSYTHLTLPTKA